MGDLREFFEIEASFGRAAQLLDNAVDQARLALASEGFEIIDQSNRSGFDRSGFPNYFWKHLFRRTRDVEGGVLLEAEVAWDEPALLEDLPAKARLRASVVVFHPGQATPLFAETPFNREVPLESCAGGGLLDMVRVGLRQAESELPTQYRAWLSPS